MTTHADLRAATTNRQLAALVEPLTAAQLRDLLATTRMASLVTPSTPKTKLRELLLAPYGRRLDSEAILRNA